MQIISQETRWSVVPLTTRCQKQILHHPWLSPLPWIVGFPRHNPEHSLINVKNGKALFYSFLQPSDLYEALPSRISSQEMGQGRGGDNTITVLTQRHRERQDRRVSHPEDRMQNLICNAGPGIPDVTKAPSLPARKIGLVTILSPNGHTLCSLELHLLG